MERVIWRRRKGSLGSVRDVFLARFGSRWTSGGGGRREERRIGGSMSCEGRGQTDFRFGDADLSMLNSSMDEFLCSCCRSVDAKLRAEGLRGGVVSPVAGSSMILFMQRSQMPLEYVMGC